ncbi:MAG: hypothetical protein QW215_00125 [Ignisphaera sp.]
MKCVFRTLHEYRFSLGIIGLTGMITGLIDALATDWSVKAFLWSSALVISMSITAYELTVMTTPEKPLSQSTLLVLTGLMGLLSIHHFTWLFVWIMAGGTIHDVLWVAPNIYVRFYDYTTLMIVFLIVYALYMIYCNICSAEKDRIS